MSERGLIVHQSALQEIAAALAAATDQITTQLTTTLDLVDQQMSGWTEETGSRQAQRDYDHRLREGIIRLTRALDEVRAAVDHHREDARDTEVENVAIVG
jgi:50S ribosomal subunit-associated GTPase HflX